MPASPRPPRPTSSTGAPSRCGSPATPSSGSGGPPPTWRTGPTAAPGTCARASTSTIGMISDLDRRRSRSASHLLTGANAAARELDHLRGDRRERRSTRAWSPRLIEEMVDRQVDGIIYATLAARSVTVPRDLFGQRVVLLNCVDPRGRPPVGDAGRRDGRPGGGRRPCSTRASTRRSTSSARTRRPGASPARRGSTGCAQTMSAAGLELAGDGGVHVGGDAGVRRGLGRCWPAGVRPRGLICLNDRVAMGVYQALAEHGLGVPRRRRGRLLRRRPSWPRGCDPAWPRWPCPSPRWAGERSRSCSTPRTNGPAPSSRCPCRLEPGGSLPAGGARVDTAR